MVDHNVVTGSRAVKRVETAHRRIVSELPHPGTHAMLEKLAEYEPRSMGGQPLIVWDRAEDIYVYDGHGNKWLDFSSGVLVTNGGHGHPRVRAAIAAGAAKGLLFSYCFPNAARAALVERLARMAPEGLEKVYLMSTGTEAVENAIKLSRAYCRKRDPEKYVVVSFEDAFHGRTLGAQMAGGLPHLKDWIGNTVRGFQQVPFPDGFHTEDTSFESFERSLRSADVDGGKVCAVLMESYQGMGASFAPVAYVRALAEWCRTHGALLVFDEVQAGFGRTGKLWGFEHYGVVPDIICCGKGISGSLPLSATIGRPEVMDVFPPGSMTSTHAGHPLVCEAGLANLDVLTEEGLVDNAREVGEELHDALHKLMDRYPQAIGAVHGKGLVAGVHVTESDRKTPNGKLAAKVAWQAVCSGLMMFAPVGREGETIKICPPLTITTSAVREGIEVLDESFSVALAE